MHAGKKGFKIRRGRAQVDIFLEASQNQFDMCVSRSGGHVSHTPLAARHQTNLVTATRGKPCDNLANRQCDRFFTFARRGKRTHRASGINNQHDLNIRAGFKALNDGLSSTSGSRPVDIFDVIAGLVFGHVHKFPALSGTRRIVLALHQGEQLTQDRELSSTAQSTQLCIIRVRFLVLVDVAEGLRRALNDPLLQDWAHGTATALKTASIKPSTEISSAIASKVRMMRWRRIA